MPVLEKRFLPVVLLTVALGAAAIAGYLIPEDTEEVPKRIAMHNTGGPVVFEHARHVDWVASCTECHHDVTTGAMQPINCNLCHDVVVDETFVADHQQKYSQDACFTCHHYQPGTQDWGHETHRLDFGLDCTSCHHADTSIEPEPANCADCHEAGSPPTIGPLEEGEMPSLADAVHMRCASCHQDWFDLKARGCIKCHINEPPEGGEKAKRMHVNMDTMTCTACHDQEPAMLIPNRMQAHHGSCMGCHAKLDVGPRTKQDCKQCHMSS